MGKTRKDRKDYDREFSRNRSKREFGRKKRKKNFGRNRSVEDIMEEYPEYCEEE